MAVESEIRDPVAVAQEIAVGTEPREMAANLQDLLGQKLATRRRSAATRVVSVSPRMPRWAD